MKKYLICLILFIYQGVYASDELSKQAIAFYSDNNYNKTMDLILQIDENERTAQDWLILGNVLDDKGEIENAVFMYNKAISTNPKYYKAYYNLANHYFQRGQYNLTIDNYKKALSLKKDNPYIYYNIACAYIKKGDLKKAKINLNKAIMIKNDIADFHYNLAYTYKQLGKLKLAQIYLNNYNKLIAL